MTLRTSGLVGTLEPETPDPGPWEEQEEQGEAHWLTSALFHNLVVQTVCVRVCVCGYVLH